MFPVPLGEASSWDPGQVAKDETVSADEAAADGIKWTFNPMVDISRDPRWGRVVEGAGEDPFVGAAIAAAKVQGLSGQRLQRTRQGRRDDQALRRVRRPGGRPRIQHVDMSLQRLFNDYLPPYKAAVDAGKLPMSFPVNVGQIPISYNELPTGRPYDPNNKYTSRYLDVGKAPQYPFGYGLSYTTFSIANLSAPSSVPASGQLHVAATITNTGSRTGDDVVQLYLHESDTSILQPVRKLEGFRASDARARTVANCHVHAALADRPDAGAPAPRER